MMWEDHQEDSRNNVLPQVVVLQTWCFSEAGGAEANGVESQLT